MTRDEAIEKATGAVSHIGDDLNNRHISGQNLVDGLVALGLLKLDDDSRAPSIEDRAARVLSTWGFSRKQIDDCFKALWINDFRIKEREE